MTLAKPSPGLIAEFKAIVADLGGAEPRKMFGYDAFFVNGNLAAGLCPLPPKGPKLPPKQPAKRSKGKKRFAIPASATAVSPNPTLETSDLIS